MSGLFENLFPNETKENIKKALPLMTHVEKSIAQFFITNETKGKFSSKEVSSLLYTSEATLSRFAKKCGYKGYRELVYTYERDLENNMPASGEEKDVDLFARMVGSNYQTLLNKNFLSLDKEKIRSITAKLNSSSHVKVFGLGYSGIAAHEFQLRFMRIGLEVEAVTDLQIMQMKAALASTDTCIIGISLSGKTTQLIDVLRSAKNNEGYTILFTAGKGIDFSDACDEVLYVASLENLDTGSRISPQFPLLLLFDIIYTYYFANDTYFKEQKLRATLTAISDERGNAVQKDENESHKKKTRK